MPTPYEHGLADGRKNNFANMNYYDGVWKGAKTIQDDCEYQRGWEKGHDEYLDKKYGLRTG